MLKIDLRRVVVTSSKSQGEYIRISSNGQIAVSSGAVEKLDIQPDDLAVFLQDKNNKKDWYFSYGKQGDYAMKKFKPKDAKDKARGFSSSALRNEVLNSLQLPKSTIRLWLSKEPLELEGKKLWKLNYRK